MTWFHWLILFWIVAMMVDGFPHWNEQRKRKKKEKDHLH
jgi:hypothetical protein